MEIPLTQDIQIIVMLIEKDQILSNPGAGVATAP